MSFRKMLGIITVVIVAIFSLMLTTSYAWYSYENASTKFDVVTASDNVEIFYQAGEYINTESAIPIKKEEVDLYSDQYDFSIRVKKKINGNEMVAKISLSEIVIDDEFKKIDEILGDSPFRVDFFYQGAQVGKTISGKDFTEESYEIGDVILSDDIDNQFTFRVYLLDNGEEQSYLMNRRFQAKIDVNVISRVNANFSNFDNPDVVVSQIKIDGRDSKYLPSNGLYDMKATCEKGSHISWDKLNKTLVYDKDTFVNDKCSLVFSSSDDKIYLKDMSVGSYVSYVGNQGCEGNHCGGVNANYVSDSDMGYCNNADYHFTSSGFRISYIKDGSAYLISGGSPECVSDDFDKIALKYCNTSYVFGDKCNSDSVWALRDSDIENIQNNKDLIDIGSYYSYFNSSMERKTWNPVLHAFNDDDVEFVGVRPIIRLKKDVLVIGGSGSYEDPYVIR